MFQTKKKYGKFHNAGGIQLKRREKFFSDTKKRKIHWVILPIALAALLIIVLLSIKYSYSLRVDYVTVSHEQVPQAFDGYKILQISDLHGRVFGDMQAELIERINGLEYDIIIMTGDYCEDPETSDFWPALDLIDGLKTDKPIYYILGESDYMPENTDNLSDDWNMCIRPAAKTPLMLELESRGLTFVYPAQRIFDPEGKESIFLTGIQYGKALDDMDFEAESDFSICVTHKPIDYDVDKRLLEVNSRTYTEADYDLSISGHTHGGQYRLPILGTLYIEKRGFFPQEKYCRGLHSDGQGRYNYICSGLSVKSGVRLFSPPELSVIELRTKNK